MFITCACEHCDQHIEFSTDEFQEVRRTPDAVFGQDVECPGCGRNTALLISQTPPALPLKRIRKPMTRGERMTAIIFVAVAFAAIGLLIVIRIYGADAIGASVGLTASALISLAILGGVVLLAIFWILFPVLMYFQLKRSNALLEAVERNTRQAPATKLH